MGTRIFFKSISLALRSKRRFWTFVIIYTLLIYYTATVFKLLTANPFMVALSLVAVGLTSAIYGLILAGGRKMDIAIFKCIGWGNTHIRTLIIGEIFFVTVCAFALTLEITFHAIAIAVYFFGGLEEAYTVLPELNTYAIVPGTILILTFVVMMLMQLIGVLLANWKILGVRPMIAIRKV